MKKKKRVYCPECKRSVRMRKDGCLVVHNGKVVPSLPFRERCAGSGGFYVRLQ